MHLFWLVVGRGGGVVIFWPPTGKGPAPLFMALFLIFRRDRTNRNLAGSSPTSKRPRIRGLSMNSALPLFRGIIGGYDGVYTFWKGRVREDGTIRRLVALGPSYN